MNHILLTLISIHNRDLEYKINSYHHEHWKDNRYLVVTKSINSLKVIANYTRVQQINKKNMFDECFITMSKGLYYYIDSL